MKKCAVAWVYIVWVSYVCARAGGSGERMDSFKKKRGNGKEKRRKGEKGKNVRTKRVNKI